MEIEFQLQENEGLRATYVKDFLELHPQRTQPGDKAVKPPPEDWHEELKKAMSSILSSVRSVIRRRLQKQQSKRTAAELEEDEDLDDLEDTSLTPPMNTRTKRVQTTRSTGESTNPAIAAHRRHTSTAGGKQSSSPVLRRISDSPIAQPAQPARNPPQSITTARPTIASSKMGDTLVTCIRYNPQTKITQSVKLNIASFIGEDFRRSGRRMDEADVTDEEFTTFLSVVSSNMDFDMNRDEVIWLDPYSANPCCVIDGDRRLQGFLRLTLDKYAGVHQCWIRPKPSTP